MKKLKMDFHLCPLIVSLFLTWLHCEIRTLRVSFGSYQGLKIYLYHLGLWKNKELNFRNSYRVVKNE